ncbi:LLM class flavin-dependent oxidoreductase [Bradyrhizobium vignae]|nr:LLM class flavin-dependent oxidoreductase [Bradyrhizobium vignae]
MSIELLMLGDQPVSRLAARTRLAEESGFETVWLADERFYRETYSCLSYLAGQTSRVKLGPCVTDPFARHPALTAMALGTLDEISEGRAILGIGAGVSGFAELGIQSRKPPLAIREAVDLIRQLMAGQEVDYRGEIIQFHRGRLNFTPLRAHSCSRRKQWAARSENGRRSRRWRDDGRVRLCRRSKGLRVGRRRGSDEGRPFSGRDQACRTP